MEDTNINPANNGEKIQVRRSYHAPQLVSLGEIQSVIQSGCMSGPDGNMNSSTHS